MAIIKSYTNIEQSKKLSEILPLESADMYYLHDIVYAIPYKNRIEVAKPCWSLAALLNVLSNYQLQTQDDGIGILCSYNGKFNIVTAGNPVDACVAMIEKLYEFKML